MLIRDVTTPNPEFLFVNDVRLSQYPDDPENLALARAYQWTDVQISEAELPSVQALEEMCSALQFERVENRRVLRATYGHGKSHLALVLANFFGRPLSSAEVQAALAGVRHVAAGKAARFEAFKQNHGLHLVLRLMGGEAESLSAMVLRGLETALRENEATKTADLGLWFDPAIAFLDKLTPVEVAQANEWLAPHHLDIAALRVTLVARDGRHRELTHRLASEIKQVPVQFGLSLAPGQMLEHVGRTFCGSDKPFAGIVVLFDEFAAFVEMYARQYGQHTDSMPLQSLLDGVQALKQRAVFVAFAQQDPDDAAELAMSERNAGQTKITELKKELTRLPASARRQLYSPMEAVLDAYLKQDRSKWDELTPDDSPAENDVQNGVDAVRSFFPLRYTDANHWTLERINTTIAYGCHPLHPLTTAVLCNADIKATGGSRTVLAFVQNAVQQFLAKKALAEDGRLCWVRPVELVRYYQQQIADDTKWQRYDDTRRKVITANIADAETVVAGMLLYEVAGFKPGDTQSTSYIGALAALTGLTRLKAQKALETCETNGYIEYDGKSEVYRFFSAGQDGSKLKQVLADGLAELRKSESTLVRTITDYLKRADIVPPQEVAFHNTSQGDWAAKVVQVPRQQWTVERLREIIRGQSLEASGKLADAARGFVIQPLAPTAEDAQFFRQRAQADLNKAIEAFTDKQTVPAVVVVLPQAPKIHNSLIASILELRVLEGLSLQRQRDMGDGVYAKAKAQSEKVLAEASAALTAEVEKAAEYVIPSGYQGQVEVSLKGRSTPNLGHVLKALYEAVYFRHVDYVSDQARSPKLRAAVGMVATRLYKGSFVDWAEATRTGDTGRAKTLYTVLASGAGSWGVIDRSERVVEPTLKAVRQAWAVLDAAVVPGAENVRLREPLMQLLNPPFGFDPYSVGLLFAAWYGVNRMQLQITNRVGKRLTPTDWLGTTNDFRVVLEKMLCDLDVCATRRDVTEAKGRSEEIIGAWRFTTERPLAEAETEAQELDEYAADESGDPRLRQEAKTLAAQITHDIKLAQEYESVMQGYQSQLSSDLTGWRGVQELTKIGLALRGSTSPLGRVGPPSKATLPSLQKQAGIKLRQALTAFCTETADLKSVTGYDLAKQRLESIKQLVGPLSEPDLEHRVTDALAALEAKHEDLSAEANDGGIRVKAGEAKRAGKLVEWRELLAYFQTTTPQSTKTRPLIEEATDLLQTRVGDAERWLTEMLDRCAELTDSNTLKQFSRDLNRRMTLYEGAPEGDQLKLLERTVDRVLTKLLDDLTELGREKPKTADEVRKLSKEYEKLAGRSDLSETQVAYVRQKREDFERRFDEQRQQAIVRLNELISANDRGDEPAPLQAAAERELEFLPDDEKPRRTQLEKDLRKRIAQSKAATTEKAFLEIGDKHERTTCLERLFRSLPETDRATCLDRLKKLV